VNIQILTLFILMTITNSTLANQKKLPPCPNTPNCVSSQAQDKEHFTPPFKISVSTKEAWNVLKRTLKNQSRVVITDETPDSLHATDTSLIFRFVDDIEVILDADARLIHIRSASRTGYSDFGVNRKRVENLRLQLQKAGVIE
jgi:uncharacterized protein (DUF1499 family)